jgi:hypothetical protein
LNTDRWFYGVFQSAPDLIRWLAVSPDGVMPSGAVPSGAVPTELDRQYRFSAPELIAGSHRLDGVLWPIDSEARAQKSYRWCSWRCRCTPTPAFTTAWGPDLLLPAAPSPHRALEQVHWVNLEELGQQENLDAAVDLLTLPVRSEQELGERCRRILANRRDLESVVFSMLFERFPQLSKEEILMIAGLPLQELRHTRAVQESLEEGKQEGLEAGRQQEAAGLAIRLLIRRLGSIDAGSRERLIDLRLQQLQQLAEDLLDFTEPGDLQAWFDDHQAG